MALEQINVAKLNRHNLGREDTVTVEQQLNKIEDDIRKLKIDFGIYFLGNLKRPPHEARGRVEASFKRLMDDRTLKFAERFRLNGIISRYTSLRELWRRTFKQRGEDFN
jgi:stress response protein SCP2